MKNPIYNIKLNGTAYNDFYKRFKDTFLPYLETQRKESNKPFIMVKEDDEASYLVYDLGNESQIFLDYALEKGQTYKNLPNANIKKLSFELKNVSKSIETKLKEFIGIEKEANKSIVKESDFSLENIQ